MRVDKDSRQSSQLSVRKSSKRSGRRRARLRLAGRLEGVEIEDQSNEDEAGQRGTKRKPKHLGKSVSRCRSSRSDQRNGCPVGGRVEQSSRFTEPPKRCRDQGTEHAGCSQRRKAQPEGGEVTPDRAEDAGQ